MVLKICKTFEESDCIRKLCTHGLCLNKDTFGKSLNMYMKLHIVNKIQWLCYIVIHILSQFGSIGACVNQCSPLQSKWC